MVDLLGPRRRTLLRALVVSLLVVVAGCATTGGNDSTADSASLTIATSFPIDDLDPLTNGIWGVEFGYAELLMRPERDGQPSPWLLSALDNVDERTWRLTLNEEVRFGSGRALDANALVQLIDYSIENKEGLRATLGYADAVAAGDLEVTLTTTRPVPTLPNALADESNLVVFDVDAYAAHLASQAPPQELLEAGIYIGPYVMTSLDATSAQLQANAEYWGGTTGLDEVEVKFVSEPSARVQAVQAGEADLAIYMPISIEPTLQGRDDSYWVTGEPGGGTFAFNLNNRRAPYDDARVRRAIYAALDYRALAEDVMNGLANVATSAFPQNLPYAADTQETDVALAGRLLDEAGFVAGADGMRARDGDALELVLLTYPQQPDSNTLGVAIQAQLKEVGIAVEVRQVEDITEEREGPDWDGALVGAALSSFGVSVVDGLAKNLTTDGPANYQGVADPELDRVIGELQVSFDPDEQNRLYGEIQTMIHEGGYYAATVERLPGIVTSPAWRDYKTPVSLLWVTAETAMP